MMTMMNFSENVPPAVGVLANVVMTYVKNVGQVPEVMERHMRAAIVEACTGVLIAEGVWPPKEGDDGNDGNDDQPEAVAVAEEVPAAVVEPSPGVLQAEEVPAAVVEPSPEVLQAEASLQEIMDAIRARMTAPAEAIEDVDAREAAALAETDRLLKAALYPHEIARFTVDDVDAREAAALAETDRLLADATDSVVYPHADRTVYG